MNISKVIDYFIPKKHLENAELYRKSQFIVWLFFVFILANPFFAIISVGDSTITFFHRNFIARSATFLQVQGFICIHYSRYL